MTLLMLETCDRCAGLHEIDCPGCAGMGLLHRRDADPTDWDVCEQCDGSGAAACPACLDAMTNLQMRLYAAPMTATAGNDCRVPAGVAATSS